MNRKDRRALQFGRGQQMQTQYLNANRVGQAMAVINDQISIFVKQIVFDMGVNSDMFNYKIELQGLHYKLLIHNAETNQIVGKAWSLQEFLDLCSNKRIEFELNTIVRKMILKSQDKFVDEVIWI